MRIIVTGGAGFIGSALCRRLISETDADVCVIDKMTYASSVGSTAALEASGRFRRIELDICDRAGVDAVIAEVKPDCIYHLAAETHVDRSIDGSADFIATNINGTHVMLEATRVYLDRATTEIRDRFRFVHISTDEVFGALGHDGAFNEASAYDPSSPYSASKAASDHLVRAWGRTYGLPVVISNCSNNYGPFQFPEKLIPLMVINALEGQALPVYSDGQQVRDWLHVDDHAAALMAMAAHGKPGEVYCVGGRSERSNLNIVEAICDHLDRANPQGTSRRDLIQFVEDRPGHDFRYAVDPAKLETELGWRASETIETGLEKTIDWYLANEHWWRPLRGRVYAGERLGTG